MKILMSWLNSLGGFALRSLLPALFLLLAGILIIKLVLRIVSVTLKKTKLEKAAHSLIKSVIRVVLYLLLGLIVASSLGIDVTGVVALASVLTLAISLSVQNALTNVIGGFTLLHTKPFVSGDYVEIAGQSGSVKEIGLTYTKLTTPDNKEVSIPNSAVVSAEIVNYTVTGTRRVDITVSASYDSPVEGVLAALQEAAAVPGLLEDKESFIALTTYGDHAISYVVRVWTKTDDYWTVHFAITKRIKELFDRDNLVMTYPHLNVHLDK